MAKKKERIEKVPEVKKRPWKLITDLKVPTYYCNTVEIGTTGADFRIRLGEVLEVTADERVVKHLATVYLSPRHAKEIAVLLQANIKHFEANYGEITLTD